MTSTPLACILRKPIAGTGRTRLYQAALDTWIDDLKRTWDPERGLVGSRGLPLPHEQVPGYWELVTEDRAKRCSPATAAAYERSAGRAGTAPLGIAAFCWFSPLSRHHGDPALLAFFAAGLRFHTESIRDDGLMASGGLNGETWAHGWDVEGLVYGITLCRDALPPALLQRALDRFTLSARRLANLTQSPSEIGSYGNQRCVWMLGLHLYGQLLDQPELIRLSDRFWEDALPKVLDDSGQVIEQMGPCMHYSYTAFFYAWLNLVIRGDESQRARIERCLEWFRCRHTESLYPIAGPSTRLYYETISPIVGDLLPAAEQIADANPLPREFATRAREKALGLARAEPSATVCGHGASPLMWALLMARDDSPARPAAMPGPPSVTLECKSTHLLKRSPLSYLLVRRDYQTHFNRTDFLPFSGIQTWALAGEPPIIHPTPLAPSTTQGDSLDTARQGVSHNWGLYGAGAVGIDSYFRQGADDSSPCHLVARYGWLWRVVVFTRRSTVILEFGKGGPRRTLWTLNRVEPALPAIGRNVVTFKDRNACIHVSPDIRPRLLTLMDEDPWAQGVRQLRYDAGEGPIAFAFSDASFRFEAPPPDDASPWRFSDGEGQYEVILDPRFFNPNPGNFRVDTYQLAEGTIARRR